MELVFRKLKECKGKPFDIQVRRERDGTMVRNTGGEEQREK